MSMEQKLQVLNALITLKHASSQLLDAYRPLVEALVMGLSYPCSPIHILVTCMLWDLGQTDDFLAGGYRSFYDFTPEDRDTTGDQLDPGFLEYFLALDINHWWEAQFDGPLAAVIVLRAPHTRDIETLIMAYAQENKDKLCSIHRVEDKIYCGLKLLVCEQISNVAILSILMVYHRQLGSVPFGKLYSLVDLMQASSSITISVEKDAARFKDRLRTKYGTCKLLMTSLRSQLTDDHSAWQKTYSQAKTSRDPRSPPHLLLSRWSDRHLTNAERRRMHIMGGKLSANKMAGQ